jgi:hypothetical protein
MSIEELTSVATPPRRPRHGGSPERWRAICAQVGVQLPDDYPDLCLRYGSGAFCSGEIWIKNPFEEDYSTWFAKGLQRATRFHDDYEMPYPAFPAVIHLGSDGLGNDLFYLVGKKQWSVVTMKHEEESEAETYKLCLTSFLAHVFARKCKCNLWNEDNYLGEDAVIDFQPST